MGVSNRDSGEISTLLSTPSIFDGFFPIRSRRGTGYSLLPAGSASFGSEPNANRPKKSSATNIKSRATAEQYEPNTGRVTKKDGWASKALEELHI